VFDPDFQFHYLRARWYNPKSGRFLERDSLFGTATVPGSLHRYAYAQHNPLAYHDPTGHDPWWNDPDFATPLNWGCGPYFPGCLFGLGGITDLAWSIEGSFPALTLGLSARPGQLPGLVYSGWEIRPTVLPSLWARGPRVGVTHPADLPALVTSPNATYYLDMRASNYGNINVLQPMPGLGPGELLRITLAPDRPAIISFGFVQQRNLQHYLVRGDYIPLPLLPY
jgi:RHS repeat-associated protein